MCLNKKRQTTGSKRVRKEHYIHFCCIRLFVNMLHCLPELFASWFQRIFPFFFFKYVKSMGANDPRTWQFWTSGAWLARFKMGSLNIDIYIIILDVGLMVLENYFFPFYSQWTIMTPMVWTNFDPRGMVGRIYVGDHWTLLYIKYISCGPELKWRDL